MSKVIELKIKPEYFAAVVRGEKKFELRYNDRDYQVGDILILREYEHFKFTGCEIEVRITHILENCGFGLQDGYAILSIELVGGQT